MPGATAHRSAAGRRHSDASDAILRSHVIGAGQPREWVMATFIVGHGVIEASGPETLVPEGRTITFYTDVGLQFWQVYGMAALQMNDATSGFKTYQSGEKVPNYFMSKYSDNERARFATVADEAANAIYV